MGHLTSLRGGEREQIPIHTHCSHSRREPRPQKPATSQASSTHTHAAATTDLVCTDPRELQGLCLSLHTRPPSGPHFSRHGARARHWRRAPARWRGRQPAAQTRPPGPAARVQQRRRGRAAAARHSPALPAQRATPPSHDGRRQVRLPDRLGGLDAQGARMSRAREGRRRERGPHAAAGKKKRGDASKGRRSV